MRMIFMRCSSLVWAILALAEEDAHPPLEVACPKVHTRSGRSGRSEGVGTKASALRVRTLRWVDGTCLGAEHSADARPILGDEAIGDPRQGWHGARRRGE